VNDTATPEQELTTFPTKQHIIHVTNHRLIFEKLKSGMTGAVVGGLVGGVIGSVIGDVVQMKLAPKKPRALDALLNNKKLYTVPYEKVESVAFTYSQQKKKEVARLIVISIGGRQELDANLSAEQAEQASKAFSSIPILAEKIKLNLRLCV
jgi:gas vesicle protein